MNNRYGLWGWFGHGEVVDVNAKTDTANIAPRYSITTFDNYNYQTSETGNGLDNLTNQDFPAIVYSISCDVTPFDDYNPNGWWLSTDRNLGEGFTVISDAGGPAFLGNTRYGLIGSSKELFKKFAAEIESGNTNLGTAEFVSKTNFPSNNGNKQYICYTHNLVGCPETKIWTAVPTQFTGVTVTVNSNSVVVNSGTSGCDITACSADNGASFFSTQSNQSSYTFNTTVRPLYITITKDNKLPYCAITGGTLSSSTTFYGNLNVLGNLTVANGSTLTIQSGSNLYFRNSSALIVNSNCTLNIQGTNASNAILDFIAPSTSPINYICASAGSHINIDHAEIRNAGLALWANDAEVHVDSCNFHNMIRPVYFYNQLGNTYGSTIQNTYIRNATAEGIWFRNSSDYLYNNKITNNASEGLRLSDYSSPSLDMNTLQNNRIGITGRYYCVPELLSNNLIKDNGMGIYAWFNSGVFADQGNNTIQTPVGYNLYLDYYSIGRAVNNYWGANPPDPAKFYVDVTSSLYYYDYLESDPGTGSNLPKVSQPTDNLQLAYNEMANRNYDEAEKLFKEVIIDKFNEKESRFALNGLASCYIRNNKIGLKDYLVNELKPKLGNTKNDLYKEYLELYTKCLAQEGKYDEALDNLKLIKTSYNLDTESKKEMDFQEGMINLVFKENIDKAKSIFEKIKADFPDKMTKFDIDLVLQSYQNGAFADIKNMRLKQNIGGKAGKINEIPVNYDLSQNYPNPFNPVTTIKYALPKNSKIILEIYSILGEKVASLVDEVKPAGYHEAVFNAGNLSSGIYIYRLTANSLETGERFVKSAKMMLVK